VIKINIGEFIKTLRKQKGLSARKLAEKSGVSQPYISQLETGKNNKPSPDVLQKLSNTLDVPYEDLMIKAGYIKTFGDTIRNLRDKNNWSLDELENQTISKNKDGEIVSFITKDRLSKFEDGEIKNPTESEILILCKAFKVPFSLFLTPDIKNNLEIPLEDKLKIAAHDLPSTFELSDFARQELIQKARATDVSNADKIKIFDNIQQINSLEDMVIEKFSKVTETLRDIGIMKPKESDSTLESSADDQYILRNNEIGNLILFNQNINYKGQPLSADQKMRLFEKVIEIMEGPAK